MNLSLLAYFSRFCPLLLGFAEIPRQFWLWEAPCQVCGRRCKGTNVLFCGNFGARRGGRFEVCLRAWCGGCYTPHPLDRFHVNEPKDEKGFMWRVNERDRLRFKQARNGDHLMTPFQSDWCLFRLLAKRISNPEVHQDDLLMCLLRWCNLDAFWGREPMMVLANRRNVDQLIQLWAGLLSAESQVPTLGPFPQTDCFGVTVAVAMLIKSLRPGRYGAYTQFETMRKLRSAYSNLHHASAQGAMAMATLGRDSAKAFLSNCPTNSLWFERFCKGCFKRMGQEAHQDLAISIKVMLALLALLDREWEAAEQQARQSLAMIGAYACIAYGGSFRGDEVFHTDLWGLLKYSKTPLIENNLPYVLIPLLGRFKNEDGEHYHLIPLAF
jgi:hypothetical protein